MRLREEARGREAMAARLLLAARGVPVTSEALAGALIEVDTHESIQALARAYLKPG